MISPSQRPLHDNTQHSDIHAPAGFEPAIPGRERPQTHALDRAATGIGPPRFIILFNVYTNIINTVFYKYTLLFGFLLLKLSVGNTKETLFLGTTTSMQRESYDTEIFILLLHSDKAPCFRGIRTSAAALRKSTDKLHVACFQ